MSLGFYYAIAGLLSAIYLEYTAVVVCGKYLD